MENQKSGQKWIWIVVLGLVIATMGNSTTQSNEQKYIPRLTLGDQPGEELIAVEREANQEPARKSVPKTPSIRPSRQVDASEKNLPEEQGGVPRKAYRLTPEFQILNLLIPEYKIPNHSGGVIRVMDNQKLIVDDYSTGEIQIRLIPGGEIQRRIPQPQGYYWSPIGLSGSSLVMFATPDDNLQSTDTPELILLDLDSGAIRLRHKLQKEENMTSTEVDGVPERTVSTSDKIFAVVDRLSDHSLECSTIYAIDQKKAIVSKFREIKYPQRFCNLIIWRDKMLCLKEVATGGVHFSLEVIELES